MRESGETSAGEYVPPRIKRLHYPGAVPRGPPPPRRKDTTTFSNQFLRRDRPRDDLIYRGATAISAESIRERDNKRSERERERGGMGRGTTRRISREATVVLSSVTERRAGIYHVATYAEYSSINWGAPARFCNSISETSS